MYSVKKFRLGQKLFVCLRLLAREKALRKKERSNINKTFVYPHNHLSAAHVLDFIIRGNKEATSDLNFYSIFTRKIF